MNFRVEGLLDRAANDDAMQWLPCAMQAFPSPKSAVVCERLFEQLPKPDVAHTNVLFGETLKVANEAMVNPLLRLPTPGAQALR